MLYFNNFILQLNILTVHIYILRKAYNFTTATSLQPVFAILNNFML
jgi:hypothetical protein